MSLRKGKTEPWRWTRGYPPPPESVSTSIQTQEASQATRWHIAPLSLVIPSLLILTIAYFVMKIGFFPICISIILTVGGITLAVWLGIKLAQRTGE